ncbi:hypothetical protein BT67DRAFT_435862 [Trichocladium antarcticum]|uniref:Uncharacterized protein n=1 Tax=Trichocladium antarcticum TaxID=1450529 RepID=A0AAN6ZBM9_9PEZI|nr:hypothetical protein BT67DRAFT_435862 [Trichocladium antarcticum]
MDPVPDTRSLRPQNLYAYTFLAARITCIPALAAITGLISHFITSTALLWTLLSSTGYSRRYLPYALTLTLDVVLVLPLGLLAALLGPPIAATRCAAVAEDSKAAFTVTTLVGNISVPGGDACVKVFATWVMLLIVCGAFVRGDNWDGVGGWEKPGLVSGEAEEARYNRPMEGREWGRSKGMGVCNWPNRDQKSPKGKSEEEPTAGGWWCRHQLPSAQYDPSNLV